MFPTWDFWLENKKIWQPWFTLIVNSASRSCDSHMYLTIVSCNMCKNACVSKGLFWRKNCDVHMDTGSGERCYVFWRSLLSLTSKSRNSNFRLQNVDRTKKRTTAAHTGIVKNKPTLCLLCWLLISKKYFYVMLPWSKQLSTVPVKLKHQFARQPVSITKTHGARQILLSHENMYSALAAWQSGHCVQLQNRRSRVRIPPWCKVFRNLYIAVLLSKLKLHCHCDYLRK
jgi:hypothetical protein